MRKDVKFGLTIGGVLVLVLVIWVSVVNRSSKKDAKNTDVTIESPDNPSTPGDPSAQPSNPVTPSGSTAQGVAHVAEAQMHAAAVDPADHHPSSTNGGRSDGGRSDGGRSDGGRSDWANILQHGDAGRLGAPMVNVVDGRSAADGHSAAVEFGRPDPIPDREPATRPTIATSGRTHVVAQGETLTTIASAVYGNGKYWKKIVDANPRANPNRLKIGQVLTIPDVGDQTASQSGGGDTAGPTAPGTDALRGAAPTADLDPSRSYRVQPSDTLVRIARRLYGRGQDWQKIYDVNRDAIGPNPAQLKVNMILRLPEPPTVASAN